MEKIHRGFGSSFWTQIIVENIAKLKTEFSLNSIQLWNDGKRWWIVSVFWQAETADNPIPEKYLN